MNGYKKCPNIHAIWLYNDYIMRNEKKTQLLQWLNMKNENENKKNLTKQKKFKWRSMNEWMDWWVGKKTQDSWWKEFWNLEKKRNKTKQTKRKKKL